MSRQIFVNLPVRNLATSVDFFTALGFRFDPRFTNDKGTCMVVAENISVMLLVESFFQTFTDRRIADPREQT